MPKGPQGQKRPADVIGNAVQVRRIVTAQQAETAEYEAGEMDDKMVFRLLLGPVCLAVMILILSGQMDFLVLARWLQL